MSRFRLAILPEAEAEIREAFRWYAERSPGAADAFRAEVFDKLDALADSAPMWPNSADGIRHRALARFPYTIHFDLSTDTVTVLAIAHQRRTPGYWKRRKA